MIQLSLKPNQDHNKQVVPVQMSEPTDKTKVEAKADAKTDNAKTDNEWDEVPDAVEEKRFSVKDLKLVAELEAKVKTETKNGDGATGDKRDDRWWEEEEWRFLMMVVVLARMKASNEIVNQTYREFREHLTMLYSLSS